MTLQDFHDGKAFDAYTYFGAHIKKGGVQFRTWAPGASRILVIGDWNNWEGEPMKKEGVVFSLLCKGAKPGMRYKYKIFAADGGEMDHADPYGFGMELRPDSASIIRDLSEYTFTDGKWMKERTKNYTEPMNIYEMHFGSWRQNAEDENGWSKYHELADELIDYVKAHNYTHIEFLPLSEHPADVSWGYQNTGFFSPTSRYGTARDLMELVDKCHNAGLGVIMDFVPVHFAIDDYALALYDGTELYEYPPSDVSGSEWGTHNFIFSRREVACFLQSAANFWLTEFHFDGIRMDAISRALYWQGDPARGINMPAVDFIRQMNAGLHHLHPTAMLIAEDSTDYVKVTAPVEHGGLGFDYKWDLGWMHDTLNYLRTPPSERPQHYHKLSFSMMYFFNELFLLPFSHDENVHGKATIIQKMWGDYEDKFPQARALYMYMYAHPGKKLNFMGNELGHFREWDETRELDWDLLRYPLHDSFDQFIRDLGALYKKYPALHEAEYDTRAFQWLEINAPGESVYIFERSAPSHSAAKRLVAAFNFSAVNREGFLLTLPGRARFKEILNSDWDTYSGHTPKKHRSYTAKASALGHTMRLDLPAFSGVLYEVM